MNVLKPNMDFTVKIRAVPEGWKATLSVHWIETGEKHKEEVTNSIYHLCRQSALRKIFQYIGKPPSERKSKITPMPEW